MARPDSNVGAGRPSAEFDGVASKPQATTRRALIVGGAALAGNAALVGRLWQLQVLDSDDYRDQAARNRARTEPIRPVRGLIYDRDRELLVRNMPVFAVWVTPSEAPPEREGALIANLSALTGERAEDLRGKLALARQDGRPSARVAIGIPRESALAIEERRHELPGVSVRIVTRRQYLHGDVMGHVVGFTGPIPAEQADAYRAQGLSLDEEIGLAGVELSHQSLLRGSEGRRDIEIDALGRKLSELTVDPPREGAHVVLTISVREQQAIREILARHLALQENGAGVVVVLRPGSGDVVAMVSLPDYDNNIFTQDGPAGAFEALASDPRRPLINHAVAGLYPPGSTYKMIAAAAALETGVVLPWTKIECDGRLVLPSGWAFDDWLPTGHGMVDLRRGIAESCNIYFYNVSGGNPYTNLTGVGNRRLVDFERGFGFGKRTGLELPGEAEGLVPTAEWKRRNLSQPWVTGDTYHAAIGQGLVQVTPVQIARMYAAIGNGGSVMRSRLVDRVLDRDGALLRRAPVTEVGRLPVQANHLKLLQEGLVEAVNGPNGTGRRAASQFATVAGKTGTAEYSGKRDKEGKLPSHAWFAGYAPAEQPEYAFAILVRDGGEGSLVAAPIAHDIVDYLTTGEMPPLPQERPDFVPRPRRLA